MISSNFSSTALLANLPIIVKDDDNIFIFNMPTVEKEYGGIYSYSNLIFLCSASMTELEEHFKGVPFKSRYDLMKKICEHSSEDFGTSVIYCLSNIINDFEYVADSFRSGGKAISEEVFELLCSYIAIATGHKEISYLKQKEEEKNMTAEEIAWEERKRKNEARIAKAKKKSGKLIEFDLIMACVCYEFHIPIKDLVQMNKYGVYFLYGKIGKISSYEVTKIAAGTGNLGSRNKHKYWTE